MVARTSTVLCSAIRKVSGRFVLVSTYLGINASEDFFKLPSSVRTVMT